MLRSKTTFVIGAGASAGLGLPVGSGLRDQISRLLTFEFEYGDRLLKGDNHIARILQSGERDDVVKRFEAAALIAKDVCLSRSIDDFLNVNQGNVELELAGKLAITRAILNAERGSSVFFEWRPDRQCFDIDSVVNTWQYLLFQILQTPLSRLDELFENIVFVVFNYDRCLEHFLYCIVKRFYRLSDGDAASLLSKAKFYHPYGMVGRLPWMKSDSEIPVCHFGGGAEQDIFKQVALSLKTYSESISEGEELDAMRASIANSDKLVFLGFAFHPQNMNLLQPQEDSHARLVYLTAKDVSSSHLEIIQRQLNRLCGAGLQQVREHHVASATCEVLLADYCRSIEAS